MGLEISANISRILRKILVVLPGIVFGLDAILLPCIFTADPTSHPERVCFLETPVVLGSDPSDRTSPETASFGDPIGI